LGSSLVSSISKCAVGSVRHMFGKRMERDVRTFKLLRARIRTHLVLIRSAYLDSLFGTQKFLLKETSEPLHSQ